MKIVIGTSRPFHLVHLARELSSLGHEVLVMGYMPKWKMRNYNLGKAKYRSFFWLLFPLSILALQRTFPWLQSYVTFKMMPYVDWLTGKMTPKCDVFIGLSGVMCDSFDIVKERYNALTICDRGSSHVLYQEKMLSEDKSSRLSKKYIKRELAGYLAADKILVPSIFSYNTFIENEVDKDKIFINNYGVDLDRFSFQRANREINDINIKAIFVGGWTFQKGVDFINGAIDKLENLIVTHIGLNSGYIYSESNRLVKKGYLNNKYLNIEYGKNNVLVLPSRQDGFGMVILEALASGIPVIASKNTGGADVKKIVNKPEYVIIMESLSKEGLVSSFTELQKVLPLPDEEILSSSDKEYFSWKAYGQRYADFLAKLIYE